ncbi:hypothetical protein ACFLYN_02500 [Chloroflexota bacterium]
MTVKVKRKKQILGKEVDVTVYLPEEVLLTRDRREKADELDEELREEVEQINMEFEKLEKEIRENEIQKWRWLGGKIDRILKSIHLIEESDITNNNIWPAIGQYLRKELKRGVDDRKRSGTKNDHYRKCWALWVTPGTDWITSWVGWDAFTDRGEQLVYSKNFIQLLSQKFITHSKKLSSDDFKDIAKLSVRYIPTQVKNPADIDSMPQKKLEEIADSIYKEYKKIKG